MKSMLYIIRALACFIYVLRMMLASSWRVAIQVSAQVATTPRRRPRKVTDQFLLESGKLSLSVITSVSAPSRRRLSRSAITPMDEPSFTFMGTTSGETAPLQPVALSSHDPRGNAFEP